MKHLRIFNLLVVLLLMAAWVPLPQSSTSGAPIMALAYSGTFSGFKPLPAAGTTIAKFDAPWPLFEWDFKPTVATQAPVSFHFQLATSSTFSVASIVEEGNVTPVVNGTLYHGTYTVAHAFMYNAVLYWRVMAYKEDDTFVKSPNKTINTFPEKVALLNSPVGGELIDTFRPELRWAAPTAPGNVASWTVQLATSADFKLGLRTYTAKENRFDVLAPDLAKDTLYYWRVQAVATNGTKNPALIKDAAVETFETPAAAAPAVPVPTSPATLAILKNYQPLFKWTGPTGSITYNLQVSTSNLFSPAVTKTYAGLPSVPANPQSYQFKNTDWDGGELPAGNFFWRVQAVSTQTNLISGWSKAFSFKTPASVTVHLFEQVVPAHNFADTDVWIASTSACTKPTAPSANLQKTNANGVVSWKNVAAGTRYLCTVIPNYAPLRKAITVTAGKASNFEIGMVTPTIKITVYWSMIPSDLDVHLWLPETVGNTNEYIGHIYPDKPGSLTAMPWAKTSADMYLGTQLSKSETITIQSRFLPTSNADVYTFAVRNSSYENWFSGTKVPYVKAWIGGKAYDFVDGVSSHCASSTTSKHCQIKFPAAADAPGIWWHVFDIVNTSGNFQLVNPADAVDPTWEPPYDPNGTGMSLPK